MLTLKGLERWYVQTVKLKHAFAGTTPPDPIPLPNVTNIDGLLEGIVVASKEARIEAAIANGYENNTVEEAYVYTLPEKLWKWVGINLVGGKSIADFSAATLTPTEVTNIVSKDSQGNVLQNYTVPFAIKSLPGYGWSAGVTYDYIDFVSKKFVKNVAQVVLDGTQTVGYSDIRTDRCRMGFVVNGAKPFTPGDAADMDTGVTASYLPAGSNAMSYAYKACVHRRINGSSEIFVSFDSSYGITNATEFKAYLAAHPLTVNYEVATRTETDISAYLSDEVVTNVVPGGTITFVNQLNAEVPVIVDYVGKK